MDGPVRRVVKYNFDHYRKRGWVGRLLFVGKESVWKAIASVKKVHRSRNIKGGNSAWVSLPDFFFFFTKGEPYCSICNENFRKFLNKY